MIILSIPGQKEYLGYYSRAGNMQMSLFIGRRWCMDKFEEMIQNMKKMTDAERTTMMGKNRALCICPTCQITPMIGLTHAYYCINGSECELRKM
jgi:Protein of unknown function (DUF2769)